MRKRESYVQTVFDALAELNKWPGQYVTIYDVLERVPWARQDVEEQQRISAGLSMLVYHGILQRTASRISHARVYRVALKPIPERRPRVGGRKLGAPKHREATDAEQAAYDPCDVAWARRRLKSLERNLSKLVDEMSLVRKELDKLD